ncbi:MAG TPA: sensor histidine kinase [Acidimicrobiales bacterium]|nr:sensor histidine kinase [Acidimicrobiales bacterium]
MAVGAFRHEAFLYTDERELVEGAAGFVEDGLDAGDAVLVVLPAAKIRLLRERLGGRAERVAFTDMAVVGRNPGRILHVWHEFAEREVGGGRQGRGIGEPVSLERSTDELAECQRYERLLNLAFEGGPPWWLMCAYDIRALAGTTVREMRRSHPVLRIDGESYPNARYEPLDPADPPTRELRPTPATARERPIDLSSLDEVRAAVDRDARRAGLGHGAAQDLVAAVSELMANSLRHGGGRAVLRSWDDGDDLVFEVEDAGVIADPLVGWRLPPADAVAGRGLWLVNQLCDLVELSSGERSGTTVRIHKHHG